MKGNTRHCRFCGLYHHPGEVIKIPAVPQEHPGKGYRKGASWAWCCLDCVSKVNEGAAIAALSRRAA
ncbi:MAG: hypothetical protein WAU89_23475 [Candidatus Acidiferrales bacterium]